MRFYLHKIRSHLQELAVLLAVFVPLDAHNLARRELAAVYIVTVVILATAVEMERRTC